MDPTIWSNLPLEVICTVVESSDYETLINWSCTSVFFYDIASDLLWESIKVGPEQILTHRNPVYIIWHTLAEENINNHQRRTDLMVPFLSKNAFRKRTTRGMRGFPTIHKQSAKLPCTRVRKLRFDFNHRGPQDYITPIRMQLWDTRCVVHKVLQLMPHLRSCCFEGPLDSDTWQVILKTKGLQDLGIRTTAEFILPRQIRLPNSDTQWASSQVLSLQHLDRLTHLKDLRIGRLAPLEAQGLAQAVLNLSLSRLRICAGPPAKNHSDERSLFAGTYDESPIITFLEAILLLSHQQDGGGNDGSDAESCSLPETLTRLTLMDVYRSVQSTNHSLLLDAVGPCQSLTHLDISMLAPSQIGNFFLHAEFPALSDFAIGCCRHFFSSETWCELGIFTLPMVSHTTPFELFLKKHERSLSRVVMSRPLPRAMMSKDTTARIVKGKREHIWTPMLKGINLEAAEIQRAANPEGGGDPERDGRISAPQTLDQLSREAWVLLCGGSKSAIHDAGAGKSLE